MGGTVADQQAFGQRLAALSGLSPQFVQAWLIHEQPPGSPATPGSNNWLNVGYTDAGPNASYWQIAAMNAQDAAAATWTWLQQNQPSIAAAAGKPAADQVIALENSGWASSHYGYQSPDVFLGVTKATSTGPQAPSTPLATSSPSSSSSPISGSSILHGVPGFWAKTGLTLILITAGALLIILGTRDTTHEHAHAT